MRNPLPHPVVILTGPLAAGKTTVREHLTGLLTALNHPWVVLDHITDLYGPFAATQGITLSRELPRSEITQIVTQLLAEHGKDLGASLLLDHLTKRRPGPVIVIDSKRTA